MVPEYKVTIDIFHAEFQSNDFMKFLDEETYIYAKSIVNHGGIVSINVHYLDAPYESFLLRSISYVDNFFRK